MKDKNNKELKVGSLIKSIESPEGAGIFECTDITNDVATFFSTRHFISKPFKLDAKNFYNSNWRIYKEAKSC